MDGATSTSSSDVDHAFKILLAGDSGVGKTSLLTRFTAGAFEDRVNTTIGVDFAVKRCSIYGKRVKLTLWDTAGQEKFRTLTSTFYRGAKGVVFVFDVTRPQTLTDLAQHWLQEIELYGTVEQAVRMIVANKVDLPERQVSWQEGSDFAKKHGCLYVETSAKTNIAVTTAFEELCLKILETPELIAESGTPTINLDADNNYSYGYCYC